MPRWIEGTVRDKRACAHRRCEQEGIGDEARRPPRNGGRSGLLVPIVVRSSAAPGGPCLPFRSRSRLRPVSVLYHHDGHGRSRGRLAQPRSRYELPFRGRRPRERARRQVRRRLSLHLDTVHAAGQMSVSVRHHGWLRAPAARTLRRDLQADSRKLRLEHLRTWQRTCIAEG